MVLSITDRRQRMGMQSSLLTNEYELVDNPAANRCAGVEEYARNRISFSRKRLLIALGVTAIVVTVIVLGVYFGIRTEDPSNRRYRSAVTTNGHECAKIGRDILERNGSAADAALAALFCEGVSCPQSMGLGGGFFLTIYTKSTGVVKTMMAREVAPIAATEDMYVNVTSVDGAQSIAVPGELKGYWELHQEFGRLPWAELIEPTIALCRRGHIVTEYLSRILSTRENIIKSSPSLTEIYVNPATGTVWKLGDVIKRPKLADTLEIIAREGVDTLYKTNGTILKLLAKDLKEMGSIITEEDFTSYKIRWETPDQSDVMDGRKMYTNRAPATGVLVSYIMNILTGFLPDRSLTSYHRIVEAFKYAYAKRTDLGDWAFVDSVDELSRQLMSKEFAAETRDRIDDSQTYNNFSHYGATYSLVEDHGTAHINVLAANGDAVSVTSTINNIFGSKIVSRSTGIILNDEMDDFSTPGKSNSYGVPASVANFIKPGKRPLSSMCPIIILDEHKNVRLLIGGAGGIKITSSVAYTIVRHWYFNETLLEAVSQRRLHHQLMPMRLDHERGFDPQILAGMIGKGHQLWQAPVDSGFTSLTAVSIDADGVISAAVDPRRGGSIEVF